MTRLFTDSSFALVAAFAVVTGCSTISRTEKQLSRVDSYESPDIPAIRNLPPVRPRQAGLAYSHNTLIVYYDEEIGQGPLRKAVSRYKADIVYDYSIVNALTVKIPDGKTLEDAAKYFGKVKGVIGVSRNEIHNLGGGSMELL